MRCVLFAFFVLTLAVQTQAANRQGVVDTYAQIAYLSYKQAHSDAVTMQLAIGVFFGSPNEQTLVQAKEAWLKARDSYGQTEVFRFYGGPIDGIDPVTGKEGPEGRINAWPLNEGYIDYIKGAPKSGIIQQSDVPITQKTLIEKDQKDDEADVTTGYHAIEFLLWGQDFSDTGPGNRPVTDYTGDDAVTKRRIAYLKEVTSLLVNDLAALEAAWAPDQQNYRQTFTTQPTGKSITDILTGLASLAGFEMASERVAVPLDSNDQEDEHSCFSDNTHNDFRMNIQGMSNVYRGTYAGFDGDSLQELLAANDDKLSKQIDAQLDAAMSVANAIEPPIDSILASPLTSPQRQQMESLVEELFDLGDSFVAAGKAMGLKVTIAGE